MTDHSKDPPVVSVRDADVGAVRSVLDRLLADSLLYRSSSDFLELLDFVVRLRPFAPFNAMLLQIQKPGLSYAASAHDWLARFDRWPKEGARPLLILWPFGPVALVYDVLDTEGAPLPKDVACFIAHGAMDEKTMASFRPLLTKSRIEVLLVDAGDSSAGLIRVVKRPAGKKEAGRYRIHLNRNHAPAVQFATLTHELGHLYLGHLGPDAKLKIPSRGPLSHAQEEIEAESVAYILCERNGVESKSQTYLASFVAEARTTASEVDVYQVMRAAGQVEAVLGTGDRSSFDRPARSRARPSPS